MRAVRLILAMGMSVLCACSLYVGPSAGGGGSGGSGGGGGGDGGGGGGGDLYQLTAVRSIGAEGAIHGVDADQQGNLWIAYSTPGSYQLDQKPVVTLVEWDPTTRQREKTFTYDDLWSPVSGLALVQGQIWLNYEDVARSDQVIRVIDPASGAIVRTLGTTGLDLAAVGSGRVAISTLDGVIVAEAATGGAELQFSSPTVVDPGDMGGISFSGTEQGIAWRPGEIWVGNWYMPLEIFDESGDLLGKVDLAALQNQGASPMHYLAFDRGQLLVGSDGQLTWYKIE